MIARKKRKESDDKMKTKVMGMLTILIIALSAAGFAYAIWSDFVTIEGTVEMGELIVGWYNTTPYELTWYEDEPTDKPWVCNATITLSDEETSVHHVPPETVYKTMAITVDAAFPQWGLNIYAYLKNAGTIPAKINPDFSISMYDETDMEDLEFSLLYDPYFNGIGWVMEGAVVDNGDDNVFGTADDVDVINFLMYFDVPEDWQIESCTEWPVTIYIDFKQEAEECHTYTFDVGIEAVQWNKATW